MLAALSLSKLQPLRLIDGQVAGTGAILATYVPAA
jgi:hypothetical protein